MQSKDGRPLFIKHILEVAEESAGQYEGSDELLSCGRPIGQAVGLEKIGLHIERLPPGRRTSWPHAEELEEEFVYVLEGNVDAWIDGERYPMKQGDIAGFPSGTGIAHTFINNSASDCTLLVGGERSKANNRIVYPLHPERKTAMKPGQWWEDAPKREIGPHSGKPDQSQD